MRSRRQIDQAPRALPPIIHIVDDDTSFRLATGNLLSACGYRVAVYDSAIALLAKPPRDEAACILLDVWMGGCSGPQLQNKLSGLGNRLPVVFVTGHADIATAVQAIKAGAEDVLTKPVPLEHLLGKIEQYLSAKANNA